MKTIYAKNPKWANRAKTMIFLMVKFEEFENELFFAANPNDSEAHGRDLFNRAFNGEFGEIEDFSAELPTQEYVIEMVKAERDRILLSSDWSQLSDVPQQIKDSYITYRQALRDLPQNPMFPWYNDVVVEVDYGYEVDVTKLPWPIKP